MQNSQLPAKWYKPFAADDAAKVEIPITTPDPTRASQSLGFPPLTMQPPESGGVPPQGEDFNGAMNQVARLVWWAMAGGALPFDNTWATNAAIGGYPQGGVVTSADLQGEWISTADNNTNNPDTNGASWVPGYAYGATVVAGLTNANVTLTPAQAAKDIIRLTGALTGNIQIIFPTWQKSWIVVNNCTGAFSVTCKTAAGSGAAVSQAGGMQIFEGDGTNLLALGGNASVSQLVGPATLGAHAVSLNQLETNLLQNGYLKLPNGVIFQWGFITAAMAGSTATFATTFPNAAWVAYATSNNVNPVVATCQGLGTSSVYLQGWTSNTGAPVSAGISYLVIGW